MKKLFLLLCCLCLPGPVFATNAVYIAQSAAGGNTGVDCADAKAASYFNTLANWSGAPTGVQIGPDTTVHLCGIWTGGNAKNFLAFQESGTSGHPVTLLFETGAALEPNYCENIGCIDLFGQSYIVINGGPTCGETSHWAVTPCNGAIINELAGSTGATCPGGACSPLSETTGSGAIGDSSGGSPTDIEVENLYVHMYTRLASDTAANSGMATDVLGAINASQNYRMHNMVINGEAKAFVTSLSGSGTISGYEVYNSNFTSQCWAMGVGANSTALNITNVQFYDNEVSDWDEWAPANNGSLNNPCHANGTMWFNGDGGTVHTTGFIGDSASYQHDNYIHGSLTGHVPSGNPGTSPSGYISCQDNCINIAVFNNLIVDDTNVLTEQEGGGAIYFNGPGGGGQRVYNNTIVRPCCSLTVNTGYTSNVLISNNIFYCTSNTPACVAIEIRPNAPGAVTSNKNDGYLGTGSNGWTVYNTASSGSFLSLATWQGTYGQDLNSVTTDPNLSGSYTITVSSPAYLLGANFTSLGIISLDTDLAGVSRPATGAWDAGAYQAGSSPTPPTNVPTSSPLLLLSALRMWDGVLFWE